MTATPTKTICGGLLGLYAQTAVHPGAGTALGTVDLPIQRERHTHWPNTAGSALKGILRDACRERVVCDQKLQDEPTDPADPKKHRRSRRDLANLDQAIVDAFGPPTNSESEAAGALSVTDARLLAFPVRSLKGVYAWVTCPMALDRLKRDAALVKLPPLGAIPDPKENEAITAVEKSSCEVNGALVLEEFDFSAGVKAEMRGEARMVADWILNNLLPNPQRVPAYAGTSVRFPKQFVILHDDWFTHFVRHATEVVARVGLDYETKTVKRGALFYQEFLPAETLLYAVVLANPARARFGTKDASGVLKTLTDYLPEVLQIGGDETTGKGYCATRFTPSATDGVPPQEVRT